MADRWSADDRAMTTRRRLAQYVESELSRNEQETGIQFFGDADRFQLTTYAPSMVRKLLEHEYAEIEWLYVTEGGQPGGRVDNPSAVRPVEEGHRIEGIQAMLPLGTLSVKGSPRQRDILSSIVSTPEEAADARAAFEQ